eukprot:Colp12_sorted_trinity150504_noHs@29852
MATAPPLPPSTATGPHATKPSTWREKEAARIRQAESETIFYDGPIMFPPSAWDRIFISPSAKTVTGSGTSETTVATDDTVECTESIRVTLPEVKTTILLTCFKTVEGSRSFESNHALVTKVFPWLPDLRLVANEDEEYKIIRHQVSTHLQKPGADSSKEIRSFQTDFSASKGALCITTFRDCVSVSNLKGGIFTPVLLRQIGALSGCVLLTGASGESLPWTGGKGASVFLDTKGRLVPSAAVLVGSKLKEGSGKDGVQASFEEGFRRSFENQIKSVCDFLARGSEKWETFLAWASGIAGTAAPPWAISHLEKGLRFSILKLRPLMITGFETSNFESPESSPCKNPSEDVLLRPRLTIIDEFISFSGHESSVKGAPTAENGNILQQDSSEEELYTGPVVFTMTHTYPKTLTERLEELKDRVDLVVLPEMWCEESVEGMREVARRFGVYLLGGTFEKAHHITAPLIDPSGLVVGLYNKRKCTTSCSKNGTEPGIFHTGLGKLSVLICHDIEHADLIKEAADARVFLIVNPCMLAMGVTHSSLLLLEQRLAAHAVHANLRVVRCDSGGTSMVVTPGYCVMGTGVARVTHDRMKFEAGEGRHRSRKEDNLGERYVVFKMAASDPKQEVSELHWEAKHKSWLDTAKAKGLILKGVAGFADVDVEEVCVYNNNELVLGELAWC